MSELFWVFKELQNPYKIQHVYKDRPNPGFNPVLPASLVFKEMKTPCLNKPTCTGTFKKPRLWSHCSAIPLCGQSTAVYRPQAVDVYFWCILVYFFPLLKIFNLLNLRILQEIAGALKGGSWVQCTPQQLHTDSSESILRPTLLTSLKATPHVCADAGVQCLPNDCSLLGFPHLPLSQCRQAQAGGISRVTYLIMWLA